MKVKFVRHGETDLNKPIRRMQGVSDLDLNANGISQAEYMRDILKNEKIDLIISSPLIRAVHTANIIKENRNIPLIIDDRIKERDYGNLEGKAYKTEYCDLDYDFGFVGGEAIENFKSRLCDFINDIKNKYNDKNVLVVSHNSVIRVLSCIVEGEPKSKNTENMGISNGKVKDFIF